MDRLAGGLVATGWSEDGLIEAVESPAEAPWLLAVQWHPEEMHAEVQAPERGLFRALVERRAAWSRPERRAARLVRAELAQTGPASAVGNSSRSLTPLSAPRERGKPLGRGAEHRDRVRTRSASA